MPRNNSRPGFRAQKTKKTLRLYIYDVIDDWYGIAASVVTDKIEEAGDVELIELYINSPGGSVFEALTIYNTLVRHDARVEVIVDGMAVSAASFLAMAGDTRTIAKNAWFMIHNAMGCVCGTKEDLRKYADLIEGIEAKIAEVYADRSGEDVEQFHEWMDEETWFNAEDALAAGLVDAIADNKTSEKADDRVENRGRAFDLTQYQNVPAALRGEAESPKPYPGRRSLAAILDDPFFQSIQLSNGGNPPMSETPKKPEDAPKVEPPAENTQDAADDKVETIELTQEQLDAKLAEARDEAIAEAQAKADAGEPVDDAEPQPITEADARKLVAKAKADSREIIAAYHQARLTPDQQKQLPLHDLVDLDVDTARTQIFNAICEDRKPVGDAGGTDPNEQGETDPDDRFRKEYRDAGGAKNSFGLTEAEYIASRRKDEGLDED